MDQTEFKIKFDGIENQIDANVLINNLIHTTSIIQEINRNIDSGAKVDIKIKALEKGSFMIHIDLISSLGELVNTLFTKENTATGAFILSILVDLLDLKKHLKGEKPKEEIKDKDKVKIINKNGDVTYIENVTYNIYKNSPTIDEAMAQSFETIEEDGSISAYEILDKKGKSLVKIEKNEFQYISSEKEDILNEYILDNEKIKTDIVYLNILRASFDAKLKWDFYFKGNKISAKVEDPNFQERIDKGESFAKGDVIQVELEIKQKFDSSVNTFVNKSYKVNKIINHIGRNDASQINMDI